MSLFRRRRRRERASGDTPPARTFGLTSAEWNAMDAPARRAWVRGFAERGGLTPAESRRLEAEADTASWAMVSGLVSGGIGTVREFLNARTDEERARLLANASLAGARLAGDRDAEARILQAVREGRVADALHEAETVTGGVLGTRKKKSGAGLALVGLALALALK